MSKLVIDKNLQDRPLEKIFKSSYARLLDFFILNQLFYYSNSDISELANIPPRTLQRILPLLIEEQLVIKLHKKGSKGYVYILNPKSDRAKALGDYFRETLKENLEFIRQNHSENKYAKYLHNVNRSLERDANKSHLIGNIKNDSNSRLE